MKCFIEWKKQNIEKLKKEKLKKEKLKKEKENKRKTAMKLESIIHFKEHRECYLKEANAILQGKNTTKKNKCTKLIGDNNIDNISTNRTRSMGVMEKDKIPRITER